MRSPSGSSSVTLRTWNRLGNPCDIPPRVGALNNATGAMRLASASKPRSRTLGRSFLSFSALAQRFSLRFHWCWTRNLTV